jgi:protein with PEP-CTERM/exosortase system signal/uncharacterized protein DUF4082
MKKFLVIALSTLASVAASQSLQADTLGLNFGSLSDSFDSNVYCLGFEFQVTQPVIVDGLAVWNESAPNGLPESEAVGLWNSSGDLLASSTVGEGTLPFDGSEFSAVSIDPLELADGTYVVGAVGPYTFGGDGLGTATGLTTAPGITYIEDQYVEVDGGGLQFPNESQFGSGVGFVGFPGGDFIVGGNPVPDSGSTMALLALAVGGLISVRRKIRFA